MSEIVKDLKCPECGGEEFQLGPRGGASRNIRCRCGTILNICALPDGRFWITDIFPAPKVEARSGQG